MATAASEDGWTTTCSENPNSCYHPLVERPIFLNDAALAAFCERNGIRRLSLFGSRLKGTERPDSDIDLLVEFFPEAIPTLFGIVRMEMELSALAGAKVDLRTAGDLSRHFREEVVRAARLQYAA